MTPEDLELFKSWGQPLPTRDAHGTEEEIEKNLKKKVLPTNWRLEGNHLKADVPGGVMMHPIPTDYILTGTDAEGLPILKKIEL